MPLRSYGVLAGRVVDRRRESGSSSSPHYQILLTDEAGVSYRVAVNVKSQESPSELLYLADLDFRHPLTTTLPSGAAGWRQLPGEPTGGGLDFIRGNLFDRTLMRPLPADLSGPGNDLSDRLDDEIGRAIAEPDAVAYVFGERWGPEDAQPDKVFGFRPGNGVHDIHMNQGNSARFRDDDGVWQDGGLLVHFPGSARWTAFFLAFQSQAWHTDDQAGHALPDKEPGSVEGQPVRIVAALVNPEGPAPEPETVTLLNASPSQVDLTGWSIADRNKTAMHLDQVVLSPGEPVVVALRDGVLLGNQGGLVTLLDPAGRKVDGVSYSAAQSREGWTVVF